MELTVVAGYEKDGKYYLTCFNDTAKGREIYDIECDRFNRYCHPYGDKINTKDIKDGVYSHHPIVELADLLNKHYKIELIRTLLSLSPEKIITIFDGKLSDNEIYELLEKPEIKIVNKDYFINA